MYKAIMGKKRKGDDIEEEAREIIRSVCNFCLLILSTVEFLETFKYTVKN